MPITEERIREIEGRIVALEQAQNDNTQSLRWLIKTLSQMKASQDQMKAMQDEQGAGLRKLTGQFNDFASTYPATVAEVVREAMKEHRPAKR